MTEEEVEARVAMIALLPASSKVRYEQERLLITELIGPAPRAAGEWALSWWQEPLHPNHALLPTVLRGIRTREPEQALKLLERLTDRSRRPALLSWLASLDYATEPQILLALLRRFEQIARQPHDNAITLFEEILTGIHFHEPELRRELAEAMVAAVKALPASEQQQKLIARAQALLAQNALHEGD